MAALDLLIKNKTRGSRTEHWVKEKAKPKNEPSPFVGGLGFVSGQVLSMQQDQMDALRYLETQRAQAQEQAWRQQQMRGVQQQSYQLYPSSGLSANSIGGW